MNMPTADSGLHPTVQEYWRAFWLSFNYCQPFFEQYARLYEFFRNKRFDALNATYSKITTASGYSAVADRQAKMYQSFAGTYDKVSILANTPEAEISAEAAQAWLQSELFNNVRIDASIMPTMQSALFGGTAYRGVGLTMRKDGAGKFKRALCSKEVEFYHVLPCPGGGHVNPYDAHQTNAVPWVIQLDWITEDAIKANAESGYFDKEATAKMLDGGPHKSFYLEEAWRNRLAVVGNVSYNGPQAWRVLQDGIKDNSRRRRIAHWYRRDKHIIVGEDAYLLREDKPLLKDGTIPLAKYVVMPDLSNWFGIPYLGILEDLLKASDMDVNYRHDHLLGAMFPTTWVRKDIAEASKLSRTDLRPKPYDVQFFPREVDDIRKAIWYDRRPEIPQHAFIEQQRMKELIQNAGGQTQTTSSMDKVAGNRAAGAVNAIMSELSARPNMESMIFEYSGFREECLLLLAHAAQFFTDRQQIRAPKSEDGFPWRTITPYDLSQDFTVITHGARYLAERDANFQKMLALYPYWNQSPVWDQYELNRQVAKQSGVLPEYEKALISPQEQAEEQAEAAAQQQAAMPTEPGGLASAQSAQQAPRSQKGSTMQRRPGRNAVTGAY